MKRMALITLILGTALAVAPAANAVVMSSADSGNGTAATPSATQPSAVTDGWMSSITPSVTLRPDILGGNGGVTTKPIPTATGGDSFAWNAAIGSAALIGAMLLTLGFAVASRRRHRLSF